VKRGLRYLKGTQNLELSFQRETDRKELTFHGFSDADWSGDGDTSRSTSGYAFICCGGAICWSSKRQSMVALSSTESEYIGLSNAGQHLTWLRHLFDEIDETQTSATDSNTYSRSIIMCGMILWPQIKWK